MQGTIQYPRAFVYLDFYEEKNWKEEKKKREGKHTHSFQPESHEFWFSLITQVIFL